MINNKKPIKSIYYLSTLLYGSLFLASFDVLANRVYCRPTGPGGGSSIVPNQFYLPSNDINIRLDNIPFQQVGATQYFSLDIDRGFECRNDIPRADGQDTIISIEPRLITSALPVNYFNIEVNLNGIWYPFPRLSNENIIMARLPANDTNTWHRINYSVAITPTAAALRASNRIYSANTRLFRLPLILNNNTSNITYINYAARQAANRPTGTCTINNNNDITIDFGLLERTKIANSRTINNPNSEEISIQIRCDTNIRRQTMLFVLGPSSPIDPLALATSDPDLAIEIYAGTRRIAPNISAAGGSAVRQRLELPMINGFLTQKLKFNIVKKAGSMPLLGTFWANATIVFNFV